jgi:hypothetical protein
LSFKQHLARFGPRRLWPYGGHDQLSAAAPCSQLNGCHPRPVNAHDSPGAYDHCGARFRPGEAWEKRIPPTGQGAEVGRRAALQAPDRSFRLSTGSLCTGTGLGGAKAGAGPACGAWRPGPQGGLATWPCGVRDPQPFARIALRKRRLVATVAKMVALRPRAPPGRRRASRPITPDLLLRRLFVQGRPITAARSAEPRATGVAAVQGSLGTGRALTRLPPGASRARGGSG